MNPEDIKIQVEYSRNSWGGNTQAIVTATHLPTNQHFVAAARSAHRARQAAIEGLEELVTPTVCRSPYCECPLNECAQGKIDARGSFPGEDHHSGDGGYQLGTREGYEAAVALRNKSLKIAEDTSEALKQTTKEVKEKVVQSFYQDLETHTQTQYLLDKLQEEAAEVIQAVSKIRRFGPHNHHPDRTETNLQELTGELEDFQAIVWALEEIKYLDPKPSTIATIKKFNTLISS